MSILATFSLPLYWSASASTVGAICLQGPHQTAQKSTRVGVSDFRTSVSKLASVSFLTFWLAIRVPPGVHLFNPWDRRPQGGRKAGTISSSGMSRHFFSVDRHDAWK